MKLKYLAMLAVGALATACSEEIPDWADPISYPEEEAVTLPNVGVASIGSAVNLAGAAETVALVQLETAGLSEDMTVKNIVVVLTPKDATKDNTPVELSLETDGTCQAAELQTIVENAWGKRPVERTFEGEVKLNVLENGSAFAVNAGKCDIVVVPEAPYISQNYWIVGAPSQWDVMCTDMPFTHSNKDVYEDPVFTVTFSVAAGDTWLAIADEKTHEANDWSALLGCAEGNGKNGMEGFIARRTELADDGSWMISAEKDCKVKMTINMMEYSYKIEFMPSVCEYYMVGRQNGWSLSTSSAFYPTADGVCSYTSYFTAAWDFRIASLEQIAEGNWSNFGSSEESKDCTTLIENTGNCIFSPAEGYYTVDVDFNTMTYSWTAVDGTPTSHATVGLIGVDGDWNNDVVMTKIVGSGDLNGADTHNWSVLGVTITTDCAVKFRANGGWDVNWGNPEPNTVENYVYGVGTQGADNIPVTAGIYNVYFNDITGQFFFVKQ